MRRISWQAEKNLQCLVKEVCIYKQEVTCQTFHPPNPTAQFQTALRDGWGYIYGASGEIWTQARQNAASREQTKKYGQKWVGHRVADCSGLFAWAFRQLGGYCYHGSNTMFRRYSSASGSLSAGKQTDGEPLKPGTAVYKFNASEGYHHVGLYIGDGARSSKPKARRMAWSSRKSAAGGRIGAN